MRYLNKIIFIKSAQINYAEVCLDGNVHLIGTQGVGKSVMLRAILFFYNADTQGLGIPPQKKSYTDYYFNHANSFIIYEVQREDGKFCVVSYKAQNRVCFRFFSGEYKQTYFMNENGDVPESWDKIAQQLDANKVAYTKRKIDEYKEYRDIIYGNYDGKKPEYRKYALLESKDYRQVPKTIQNVFLNSKMEADFIKRIIILSLDNDVRIDLNQYAHHLNDFESQLADIRKFKMPSTTSQAENIAKLFVAIRHLEREKIRLTGELGFAVSENEKQLPELTERLKTQREKETMLNNKLTRTKELFDDKAKEINGKISVQKENLKKAKELSEFYERQNIRQIIAKVEKKNDIEKEKHNLLSEKALLTTQFADLEAKYNALLGNLENQFNDFLNGKNFDKNTINAGLLAFKENSHKVFSKIIAGLREEHKKEIDLLRANWEDKKRITNELYLKKEGIKHTRFFEAEISQKEKEMQELVNLTKQLPADKENLAKQIETIQKQWELDRDNLQKDFERNKEKVDEQINTHEKQIFEIESYIAAGKDSFYGWLTDNYPNWEKSIGKVIDDKNVLFNSSLNPRFMGDDGNLYGVVIDLTEISKTVKTIADYEAEKEELSKQVKVFKKHIAELMGNLEGDKEKLKKKYQPRIREKKEAILENEYHLEQTQKKYSETTLKLNEWKSKAVKERATQLENIDIEIDKAVENAKIAELEVGRMEEEQQKAIKAKEKERDKRIETEQNRVNALLIEVEAEIKVKQTETQKQKDEINRRKNQEFSEKGADTKRLNEIDSQIMVLENELRFIEDNQVTVIEYRKDKRDFMDKVNEFKQENQRLEKQWEIENLKFEKQKSQFLEQLSELQAIISDLENRLKIAQEDIHCFVEFQETDCYKSIAGHLGISGNETNKRIKVLIEEIRAIHYDKLSARKDELRTTTIDFLGKFSEKNIFKFKKQVAGEKDILDFAEKLSDFVADRRIERIEKEVNERFALIISTIGTETGNLMAKEGEIQTIITKINNDFIERESIGAGVIQKVELKIEDSKNEIVQLLLLIKRYNDENVMEFGAPNLFSTDNQEKKNKEAVELLKQFVKKINEMRRDTISLSDSFELKFRIEENRNDTGWQEKLTNVGSEGTDTLVKAMVNIMLLNVFKESVSKRFKDFRLHCMMDEIGKLHPNNVRGILKFANDRNILLINSSPIENDALAFTHIYRMRKDERSITQVKRIISQH